MNVLSLFSGVGGLELGLERAGMTTIGQVEIDPYCQQVLARHWPGVPRHDDVRTTVEWWTSEPRPRVDVVCGGFPCQPFSLPGKQRGTADERWGWPWMESVIRGIRPRFVLVENVAALVRDSKAWGTVLSGLHRLGFDAEWSTVSACSVGAPHVRRRVFLLAHARGAGLEGLHLPRWGVDLQPAAGDLRQIWKTEPDVDRVDYGIPVRLVRDPIKAYGNAVVPQVAEHIGRLMMEAA